MSTNTDPLKSSNVEDFVQNFANVLNYTNEDNPYGDCNLTKEFIWHKNDKKKKKTRDIAERIKELENAKKRREEYDEKMSYRQKARVKENNIREISQYGDLNLKEETLNKSTLKQRSRLRLKFNRPNISDMIYVNVLLNEDLIKTDNTDHNYISIKEHVSPEIRSPVCLLKNLSYKELSMLISQIRAFVDLSIDKSFWEPILTIVDCKIAQLNWMKNDKQYLATIKSVNDTLEKKSLEQLKEILKQLENVNKNDYRTNKKFWSYIKLHATEIIAEEAVRKKHENLLKKLNMVSLKKNKSDSIISNSTTVQASDKILPNSKLFVQDFFFNETISKQQPENIPIVLANVDSETRSSIRKAILVKEQELNQKLSHNFPKYASQRVFSANNFEENDDFMFEKLLSSGETIQPINENKITPQEYKLNLHYQPRKPRFFNRVKTNYDWNKYNKTHYSHDKPPPKTIQGYKFRIYYPDLIDKSVPPKYSVEPDENPEFAILRFSAGPPYEDIAFRIINKQWKVGQKYGFRCVYEHDQLQLEFSLKRYFYRR